MNHENLTTFKMGFVADGRQVRVVGEYRGKKEISDAMERIYELLHDTSYSVSGADMVVSQVRSTITLVENDGITRHGVLTLSVIVYDN